MMHHHHHGHDHDHHHDHKQQNQKSLLIAFSITTFVLIIELIGGWITNSLALLSDAGHMFSDAASLLLSFIAVYFATNRPSNLRKSYGYHRFEILAALINGVTLLIVAAFILKEAFERFQHPPTINGQGMLFVAIIGLLCNFISAWILMRNGDVKNNLNIRSAYLHVISDALGSVGAILAAIAIQLFAWSWADSVISVLIALLIVRSGWGVVKHSTHILMEGTPDGIDLEKVKQALMKISGVIDVHDLHIWTITSGLDSLSCHLLIQNEQQSQYVLKEALHCVKDDFHIGHATIQVETSPVHHEECRC